MIKNKKASVPVTILVIGVFALCAMALIAFFISEFNFSNSFAMVDDLRAINVFQDEWNFYKNQGKTDSQILNFIEFPISSEEYKDYSISVTLDGTTKVIEVSRVYGKSLARNLFSKNVKSGDLIYSVEYRFD